MVRPALILTIVFLALPVLASADADKEVVCGHQGDIANAVKEARLDGVQEGKVQKALKARSPTWPENYNNAIPTVATWIYGMDMSVVRDNDLGAFWKQECLKNWDAIQKTLSN